MRPSPLARPSPNRRADDLPQLRTVHRSPLRSLLTGWLSPWLERRHVARTSRQLLAVYRQVIAEQPDLPPRALQRRIVMIHLGAGEPTAEAVLQQAEENFATWPVRRALNLVDIIHYVAFQTFVADGRGNGWTYTDFTQTIREHVPQELWLSHSRDTVPAAALQAGTGRIR